MSKLSEIIKATKETLVEMLPLIQAFFLVILFLNIIIVAVFLAFYSAWGY